MLTNMNLHDTDFKIVTVNIDFERVKEPGVQIFEETKTALRKHQYCKMANSKSTKTLLAEMEGDKDISDDLV